MATPAPSTRQAAVEAAVSLLEGGDPAAVSMRAVAERIGVSAPALYRHFSDRAELVRLAVAEVSARFRDRLERGFAQRDPADRLLGLLLAARDFGIDHPGHYRVLFLHRLPGSLPPRYPAGFKPPGRDLAGLVAVIEECMAAGILADDDPVDLAMLLVAAVHGLMRFWLLGRFGEDRTGFERFFEASMARLLAGPGRPSASG